MSHVTCHMSLVTSWARIDPMPQKEYSAPPSMAIDPNKQYSATFKTPRGEIVCDLFAKAAPKTVNNFVFLAREKFYAGTAFPRVLANFMIQGRDPTAPGP